MKRDKKKYWLLLIVGIVGLTFSLHINSLPKFFSELTHTISSHNEASLLLSNSTVNNVTIQDDITSISEDDNQVQDIIKPGETAGLILQEWMDANELRSFVEACNGVYDLDRLRSGQAYTITKDKNGFCSFQYEIDKNQCLVVNNSNSLFTAAIKPIQYDIQLDKITGKIESSLFLTMAELGELPTLAIRLSDIFAWEINFIKDIQPGDFFTVLIEKRFRDGEFKGYGKLLAAEFSNRGKVHDAYLFEATNGGQYYNKKGESLKRQFLKAPLAYSRISSRFTTNRFHPILKTWRAHPAVDYAAPTGTPVKAVGDGQVIFVGRSDGAGNYIKIKHNNSYETAYLHLSKFASKLKKGKRVEQGEVIGYVGSTGYATGPHLDFRMKKNGAYVNPETALSPRSVPLSKSDRLLFAKQRDMFQNYFNNENAIATYGKEDTKVIVE